MRFDVHAQVYAPLNAISEKKNKYITQTINHRIEDNNKKKR